MELTPCILERKILPKVWGGRALETALGLELPDGAEIGESWEVYDRPDGSSRLRDSDLTLRDLMQAAPDALLGRGRPARGGRFPLLLKYIDAKAALSVQVHPDDTQAEEDDDDGKPEAWVVLHAGPEARILCGVEDGVTREQFAAALEDASVEELLREIRPNPGDVINVPTGTVHSIGPDVVLFEVQQNSDVTYRLYDWGRSREMHVDKGLRAARFDAAPASVAGSVAGSVASDAIDDHGEWLLREPRFRVRRLRVHEPTRLETDGRFMIVNLVSGHASIGWHSGGQHAPLMARRGDTALIPASTVEVFISPIGGLEILVTEPGDGA